MDSVITCAEKYAIANSRIEAASVGYRCILSRDRDVQRPIAVGCCARVSKETSRVFLWGEPGSCLWPPSVQQSKAKDNNTNVLTDDKQNFDGGTLGI